MTVVGLFAGIGGFEVGLQRSGFHPSLLCDVLPASKAVLAKTIRVASTTATTSPNFVPCPEAQRWFAPAFRAKTSARAGRTAGIDGEKSGLIGEVFRLLRRQRVPTVIVENVPFMLQLSGGSAMRAIVDEFDTTRLFGGRIASWTPMHSAFRKKTRKSLSRGVEECRPVSRPLCR